MTKHYGMITIACIALVVSSSLSFSFFDITQKFDSFETYYISEKPEKRIRIFFDSPTPLEATLRKSSNYHVIYDVTEIVSYQDNWVVAYNKRYVINVKWDTYLYDGDIIVFRGILLGSCPEKKILLTAPNDPSIVYGEYTFSNVIDDTFNITLDIPDEINEFDIVIHYSCSTRVMFIFDYVSFVRGNSLPFWRDESGVIITQYHVSFDYQVNISSQVDPTTIQIEINANTSIVTPAGTTWIPNHGIFYELFPVEPFIKQTWTSRWVALPLYPPPFCMWNTTEYGDDDSQCMYRTQMNITVDAIVRAYGKLLNGSDYVTDIEIEKNIRNYPIFWY